MQTRIQGTTMPVLDVQLDPNESVFSESGELSWMSASIQMTTHTQMGGGGGLFGVLKRAVAGGSIFMTEYRAMQYPGEVSFATKVPGHIVPVQVNPGQELMVHRHGFLCATPQVTLNVGFQQNLGAGIFGGDGFILQKVTGPGVVWLDLSGELVERNLAAGERLLVHAGHVGLFEPSVGFDIQMVSGFKNVLFGGEGLFLATLTGPGHIAMQSMPIMNLAEEIGRYLPGRTDTASSGVVGNAVAATAVGGILGSLFGGSNNNQT